MLTSLVLVVGCGWLTTVCGDGRWMWSAAHVCDDGILMCFVPACMAVTAGCDWVPKCVVRAIGYDWYPRVLWCQLDVVGAHVYVGDS